MVGRSADLRIMQDAMARAGASPTAMLISGEAGIGKSRLIHEFSSSMPAGSVAYGACMELAGEPIVFAAIKEALRHVEDHELEPRSERASSSASLNRIEQFDQWARLLEEPDGQLPPRVLVIEDLHWADDSTLSFLSYLLRSLRRYRLMVIVTRRDDEIPRAATSDAVLAELLRLPYLISWQLSRLTEDEAGELTLGIDRRTAGRWYELSEGNPYLLGELVAAGGQMPGHMRDILIERVRRLSPDAQSLARVAAVAGLVIDDEILWRASPLDETHHLEALHDIVDGGVLRIEGGRYAFRHSLTREALLDGLLPFEVRRLNAAIAAALEQESGPPGAVLSARIAAHWHAAGDPDRTFQASLLAARQAYSIYAFPESWHHYRRALDLLEQIGAVAVPGTLLVAAADAARWAGDLSSAVSLLRRALLHVSDVGERAALHERLGRYLWEAGGHGSHKELETATELLQTTAPIPARATVLAAQARGSMMMTRYERAADEARRALEEARRWELQIVEADALTTLATAESGLGDSESAIVHLRDALALAKVCDDFETICRTYGNLTFVLVRAGAHEEAGQAALEGLQLLRSRGLHLGVGATLANNAASILILRGRYKEAEELLTDILSLDVPQGRSRQLYISLAELHLRLGQHEAARENLVLAAEVARLNEPHLRVPSVVVEAELLLQEKRFDQAFDLVVDALGELEASEDVMLTADLCRLGLRIAADRAAQPSRQRSNLDEELRSLVARIPEADSASDASGGTALAACLATARAEERRARHGDDWECWHDAADRWVEACQPWDVAYCRLRESEHAARRRLAHHASDALAETTRIASELGAQPLLDAADALARGARLRVPLEEPAETTSPANPFGLTRREQEVCEVMAQGATNREIATKLYISERTAAVHVSSILRKLGVQSRLEASLMVQTTADQRGKRLP
jgi:DNA-binding CsgD family transcriptional regulator/tetratricopeptide (TPR) repeat protein